MKSELVKFYDKIKIIILDYLMGLFNLVKDGVTVGIGTGEQDRVGVAEIVIFKAYTKYADALPTTVQLSS